MSLQIKLFLAFLCASLLVCSKGFSTKRTGNRYGADLLRTLNCLLRGRNCLKETPARRTRLPYRSSVYLGGRVYTVDKHTKQWHKKPEEALVVEDGKIAFVGSNEEAVNYIYDGISRIYDLNNYVVLPGIHDVHMHPLEARSRVGGTCILPNMKRPDDKRFRDVLKDCPKTGFGTEWVLGGGHSITPLLEYVSEGTGKSPKELLDEFIPKVPAAMLEETSHSAWVNSMALRMANITAKTPARRGGVIMREPNSNEPNGILFENEAINIFELALDPTRYKKIENLNYKGLKVALHELSMYGITSFCDARLFWGIGHHLAWKKVCDAGYLKARAILGLWAYPNMDDDDQIKELKNLYSGEKEANCELRRSQIKVYMDGIVESTTAAMNDKYLVNLSLPIISVENVGMNYFDKARLEKYLSELQDFGNGQGFDFHIHAIGDRGIHDALDAIKAAKKGISSRIPRHRLTHLEVLDKRDVPRFAELGVIADFQVAGTFTLPSEHGHLAEFIGMDKAKFSIPVKSVVDTGAYTTFSSDWDVSDVNPFIGIQHATERRDQSVPVETAIEMYTVNPAFAMRQEESVGALKAGMDADFIIIDQDILNIPHDKISNTVVLETFFKDERIYPNKMYPDGIVISDITEDYYDGNKYYYWW